MTNNNMNTNDANKADGEKPLPCPFCGEMPLFNELRQLACCRYPAHSGYMHLDEWNKRASLANDPTLREKEEEIAKLKNYVSVFIKREDAKDAELIKLRTLAQDGCLSRERQTPPSPRRSEEMASQVL